MTVAPLLTIGDLEREGLLKNGKPRLESARGYFLGLRDLDFQGLVSCWKVWKDYVEYLVLQKQEGDLGLEKKTIAVKCSKRGNDVYWWRTGKRLEAFRSVEDVEFFNPRDRGRKTTRAVFVTLTWDPKMGSIEEAWKDQASYWNRWITNLREKYGRIRYVRTWESFISGYPHVHALLVFEDHEFVVMRMKGNITGRVQYRVTEKAVFEEGWPAFVDVQACSSLRRASLYITKYATKSFHEGSEEALDKSLRGLTLAMNWIFRKRSFAVSRGFRDLIAVMRNSKREVVQGTLDGGVLASESCVWVCLGVHSAVELGLDGSRWFVLLESGQIDPSWGASLCRM